MAKTIVKNDRDIRQYCDDVFRELGEVKTKIFNIVCRLETSTAEEDKRRGQYFDLFDIVDKIEEKLELLIKDCPADWKAARRDIEGRKGELDQTLNWWFG